jgi:septum formation protein
MRLLQEAGFSVERCVSNAPEIEDAGLAPEALAMENARLKWVAVAGAHRGKLVLAADTVVWLDGKFYAKPADMADAERMLGELAGRTHRVVTGVAIGTGGGDPQSFFDTTLVAFWELGVGEIREYLGSIDPLDKAGGYAAQDGGERIIASVEGSMSNVVGLPMEALAAYLRQE